MYNASTYMRSLAGCSLKRPQAVSGQYLAKLEGDASTISSGAAASSMLHVLAQVLSRQLLEVLQQLLRLCYNGDVWVLQEL